MAITPVGAGAYSVNAGGHIASIWLGVNWLAWAVLWFLFFALLVLERRIPRITGLLAIVEGIGTSWVFGFLLLQGTVKF